MINENKFKEYLKKNKIKGKDDFNFKPIFHSTYGYTRVPKKYCSLYSITFEGNNIYFWYKFDYDTDLCYIEALMEYEYPNDDEGSVLLKDIECYKNKIIDNIKPFQKLDIDSIKYIKYIEYMPEKFKEEYNKFYEEFHERI